MAVINPLSKEKADASVHGLYDAMAQKFGFMPNIFGVMAHRPEATLSFASFFQLIIGEGTPRIGTKSWSTWRPQCLMAASIERVPTLLRRSRPRNERAVEEHALLSTQ